MKFLFSEFAHCLCKSIIRPYMEYCCHVWTGALRYYFGRYSSKLAEIISLSYFCGSSTHYSNWLHDFLSPFLYAIRMSLTTTSFFAQLDYGILCLFL